MSRLWEKGLPLDERILRYTAGEDHRLDARLVPYDVRGSIAHAEMLAATKLISDEDCAAICGGLRDLQRSFEDGDWHISLDDEDVHTALESRLTGNIGAAGGRLHLGRSRNDQVLTALRLYLRDTALDLAARVDGLRAAIADLAKRQGDVELPGYTHMQHAMPSSVALWCGGFDEGFADAAEGLRTVRKRINKNPLGSAAGYGTPGLPLDRELTTAKLEFDTTQTPVTAAQLSRGKAESALLFEIALMMQDLSRMASDLLMFYTQEFAYISLAPEVTTGSSIMPQKRNPDVLELLRASSATTQACLDEASLITAQAALRVPPRPAAAQVARCSARSISRSTASTSWRTCSRAWLSGRRTSGWMTGFSPRPRRIGWLPKKGCPFARHTGKSPNATQNDPHSRRLTTIIGKSSLMADYYETPASRARCTFVYLCCHRLRPNGSAVHTG